MVIVHFNDPYLTTANQHPKKPTKRLDSYWINAETSSILIAAEQWTSQWERPTQQGPAESFKEPWCLQRVSGSRKGLLITGWHLLQPSFCDTGVLNENPISLINSLINAETPRLRRFSLENELANHQLMSAQSCNNSIFYKWSNLIF